MADILSTSGIKELVNAYKTKEINRQVAPLQNRRKKIENLKKAWEDLSNRLQELKTRNDILLKVGNNSIFKNSKIAKSSAEKYVKAEASSTADFNSYNIRPLQLAKKDIVLSVTDIGANELFEVTAGVYQIKIKSGSKEAILSFELDGSENYSQAYQKIYQSALNNNDAKEILSVAYFSPNASHAALSFTAKNTGLGNKLIFEDLNGGIILEKLNLTHKFADNELNAKFLFNGIEIIRESNTIDDIVEGVKFTLTGIPSPEEEDVNIRVEKNTSAIFSDIKSFFDKFNQVFIFIQERMKSNSLGRGVFAGNSTISSLYTYINSILSQRNTNLGNDKYQSLYDIGVTFDPQKGITIDEEKFKAAFEDKPEEVENFFNNENYGLAKIINENIINKYIGDDGTIKKISSSYDKSIKAMNDKISLLENRIERSANILRSRYQSLQLQLASLFSQQSFFSTFRV
jgi:flagellar hook-associated protein 2